MPQQKPNFFWLSRSSRQTHPADITRVRVAGLLLLALVGCAAEREAKARESSHLRPIVIMYGQYLSRHGSPPPGKAAFQQFITQTNQNMLANLGIEDVEDLFISQRDGQPFVILYERPQDETARDVVAYEQEGVEGKRMVGFSVGLIAEVDETEFGTMFPPM